MDSVAQPVEQRSFKPWVLGSNPSAVTESILMWDAFFIFKPSTIEHLLC